MGEEKLKTAVAVLLTAIGTNCYCALEGMSGCDYCKYKMEIDAVKEALE